MPRNKQQNEEIRQQRKEAIIRGALKIYVKNGYTAAEIGDVAEEAGVARGLVYYYFKDKLTLFRELFSTMFELSSKRIRSHFEGVGSVHEMLEKFAQSMYSNMLEQSDGVLFFMRMRHDLFELFTPEELKNWSWHIEYMQVIGSTLQRGMDAGEIRQMSPQLLAQQFWGAVIHGMMFLRQSSQELLDQGFSNTEVAEKINQDIQDAVACCLALVSPSCLEKSSGDDPA